MGKGGRTARERADAASELQRAGRLLEEGNFSEALPILRKVSPVLAVPAVDAAIGDSLHALGKIDDALEAYRSGLKRFPDSEELALRLGGRSLELGRFEEAIAAFRVARAAHKRDPGFLRAYAYASLQAQAWDDAASLAEASLAVENDPQTRLVLGLAQAGQGRFSEAAATLEQSQDPAARAQAARFHALGGNLKAADSIYAGLAAAGALAASDWAPASQVAAWLGDRDRAERYLTEATSRDPGAATQLAAAQLALSSQQPERALKELESLRASPDDADRALALVLTARAHRQRDEHVEAKKMLDALPPSAPRIQALALVERGHLHALAGEFEEAEHRFADALKIDPTDPEAARGLERAKQRLSWQREVLADASKQVESARAEADAIRRAVADREHELGRLKRQLAELERQRQEAEKQARAAERTVEEARLQAEADRKRALQGELEAREAEAREKVEAEIARAFGNRTAEAPPKLVEGLRVAELTYQKTLQTELPGAGVAVLYSGVLERALYVCIVAELERYLDDPTRRNRLLQASRRGERHGKPEYVDHFVGAFDREQPMRAPGLGEVARVVRKRNESHLEVVREFLEQHRGYPPAFLDGLATFIEEAKVRLRDPIAHGRILEIGDKEISELRKALIASFQDGPGVLYRLAFPRG